MSRGFTPLVISTSADPPPCFGMIVVIHPMSENVTESARNARLSRAGPRCAHATVPRIEPRDAGRRSAGKSSASESAHQRTVPSASRRIMGGLLERIDSRRTGAIPPAVSRCSTRVAPRRICSAEKSRLTSGRRRSVSGIDSRTSPSRTSALSSEMSNAARATLVVGVGEPNSRLTFHTESCPCSNRANRRTSKSRRTRMRPRAIGARSTSSSTCAACNTTTPRASASVTESSTNAPPSPPEKRPMVSRPRPASACVTWEITSRRTRSWPHSVRLNHARPTAPAASAATIAAALHHAIRARLVRRRSRY